MSSETTTINPLIEKFAEVAARISSVPRIPLQDESSYQLWDDNKVYFSLIQMLYESNPSPMREAIVHFMKNNTITGQDNKLSFVLYLCEGLRDPALQEQIFDVLLCDKNLNHLFIIDDQHFNPAGIIFSFGNDHHKKMTLEKSIRETKIYWKQNGFLNRLLGSFLCDRLRIIDSNYRSERKRAYLKFFIDNYTVKEREKFLQYMLLHWQINRKKFFDWYANVSEDLLALEDFHPSVKQIHMDLSLRICKENSLVELEKERFFYSLPKNDDHIKKIVSEIHRKCYAEKYDFFTFTANLVNYIGANNIEKYRNFA